MPIVTENTTFNLIMIPPFDEIRIQALKELQSGAVKRAKDLRDPLARFFNLTDEELNRGEETECPIRGCRRQPLKVAPIKSFRRK